MTDADLTTPRQEEGLRLQGYPPRDARSRSTATHPDSKAAILARQIRCQAAYQVIDSFRPVGRTQVVPSLPCAACAVKNAEITSLRRAEYGAPNPSDDSPRGA